MPPGQPPRGVRHPLALPPLAGGVRTAAVSSVGVATLAAFVGGGLRDTLGSRSIFFVPAVLHLLQWIIAWRLDRASAASVAVSVTM